MMVSHLIVAKYLQKSFKGNSGIFLNYIIVRRQKDSYYAMMVVAPIEL